jgi:hypothetical protein
MLPLRQIPSTIATGTSFCTAPFRFANSLHRNKQILVFMPQQLLIHALLDLRLV